MVKIKKIYPYIIVLILFYGVAYLFTPEIFKGKVVNQADISSWRGMANEIIEYNESHPGEEPALWTNSMFSGMPATTISLLYKGDYTDFLYRAIHKVAGKRPPSYLLISLIGSFLLFLAFGVNLPLATLGAFAITFCSYNLQIIEVGHNSKMVAIAFMPWVLAALVLTFKKRATVGALLFAFALSFEIKANHPQITYYLAMIVVAYLIAEFYKAIKGREFPLFLKRSLLILASTILAVTININHLWPTYEYSKYSMRGGSELAKEQGEEGRGLDLEYATSWSYSLEETLNLMIPNFNGGSSVGELPRSSESYKALQRGGYSGANSIIKQLPLYWGPQPFTAGPSYLGAISIFLFIMALLLIKGPDKWWIASISLLALLLSWGSNLQLLTELFFKYLPLYNRFRTVSMILVILQITVPLLAILLLQRLLVERRWSERREEVKRALLISLALTAGVSLLFALFPSLAGSFVSPNDSQLPSTLREALALDRATLLRKDALISALFILLAAAAVWLGYLNKIGRDWAVGAVALLTVVNLWSVGGRYLNKSHFVKEELFTNQYPLREVDKIILSDSDPHYRVLDLSVNTFNDSHVSYHHKTIGGYSPAKLRSYQDLIEYHIGREISLFGERIADSRTVEEAQESMGEFPVLNMLNAKYFILEGSLPPIENRAAYGNSWFVTELIEANSLTDEITLLGELPDLKSRAVVNSHYYEQLKGVSTRELEEGEFIELTHYSPNSLLYNYNSHYERLALFSEIYYPAGWNCYIDGESVDIIKANYLLRALKLPPGSHRIEFRFEPQSYRKGALYSSIASTLLIVLSLLWIVVTFFRRGDGQ